MKWKAFREEVISRRNEVIISDKVTPVGGRAGGLIMQVTSSFWGVWGEKDHMTDFLIDSDQKISDRLLDCISGRG